MTEAGAVVPVNGWLVLALVLLAWLCWAVSVWQKRHADRDRSFARRHRYGR